MTQSKISIQLADTILARYPHPDNFPYRSWSYPQGLMLMGFIRLYEDTGEQKYRDYVLKYADFHVAPDGSMYRFTGESMDDMMSGAVIAWAWHETGLRRYRKACDLILSQFESYPRNCKGGFWHGRGNTGEMWVDGVFMGGMFLIHYGTFVGKQEACFAEVLRQLDVIYDCCHKRGGLLVHAWSENPQVPWADPVTGRSSDVWSEGLGWYALILAETLRLMPEGLEGKKRIASRLEELLNTLTQLQDPKSGLFYQVVDKGEAAGNWTDTSGSAMFLYAFAQAVRLGIGSAGGYRQVLDKGFGGIRSKVAVNEAGLMDVYDACDGLGVQNSFDDYITYPRVVNAKEAVGAVLWASEVIEWRV